MLIGMALGVTKLKRTKNRIMKCQSMKFKSWYIYVLKQANQSSIIGHGVVMANGTEYQEINDVLDAQDQDNSPVNGVLALHDEHGQEESGRYETDIQNRSHKPQLEGHEEPKADSERRSQREMTLSTNVYTNDYFSVEKLDSTPYFVLELGNEPKYVNERWTLVTY